MSEDEIVDTLSGHNRRNFALQENLRQTGVDISDPRAIELHFWSADQQDAVLLGRALYQLGFLVLVLAPGEREPGEIIWNVEAGIKEPVSRIATPAFSEKMIRLAAEHASTYDGWGTSV